MTLDNDSPQLVDTEAQQVIHPGKTVRLKTVLLIASAIVIFAVAVFGILIFMTRAPKQPGDTAADDSIPGFNFSIYEGKNKLKHPIALISDKDGRIYVSNNDMHTVEVFSANGEPDFSFGGMGQTGGQFTFPYGIGMLPNGNILVAETGNYRIQELTANGKYIRTFVDNNNRIGLQKPGPLYVDTKGLIYVGDLSGQQVLMLKQDGTVIRRFSGILYPHGLAVDEAGQRLFVGDGANNCVKVFSLKNGSDIPVKVIGGPAPEVSFSMVRGLALDESGRLFVVDTLKSTIEVFDKEGNFIFSLGAKGQNDGEFLYPYGIASNKNGKIYVADWGNNRVQVWSYQVAGSLVRYGER